MDPEEANKTNGNLKDVPWPPLSNNESIDETASNVSSQWRRGKSNQMKISQGTDYAKKYIKEEETKALKVFIFPIKIHRHLILDNLEIRILNLVIYIGSQTSSSKRNE